MSSTTSRLAPTGRADRSGQRGQVLVLFAGGVLALLVVAALAFDVGMLLLERRDQQNAADAAALAGARYVFDADCDAAAGWACVRARAAANAVALANGFDDADLSEQVTIHIPALNGRYVGLPHFIEVDIDVVRPSIFAPVIGKAQWPVGVFAVATNDNDLSFPFSMLALNETACKAIHIAGTGVVDANGNVQSNSNGSDCSSGEGGQWGLSRTGSGTININTPDATCRSAGDIQDSGAGTMNCAQAPDSFALPDPLADLDPPAKPGLAPDLVRIGHTTAFQPHCPGNTSGGNAFTETQTTGCDIAGNGSASRGTDWLLSPGLYPAGLRIDNQATAYLLPGVYWIGGGGLEVTGDASLISVASLAEANAMNAAPTFANIKSIWDAGGGGVMFYNSSLPTSGGGDTDVGGGGGVLLVRAMNAAAGDPNEVYNNLSFFQDRSLANDVTFNGSTADAEVTGIIYASGAHVTINGSSSSFTLDQVIADTFKINGNGGTIEILKRVGIDVVLTAAGLVD